MERVRIFDTTLRDGEQSPGCSMRADEKVAMARQLETLGVDVLEAGFAAASPGEAQAVFRVAETVTRPVVACLARTVKADIDAAREALRPARRARCHVFIATSEIHLTYKLRTIPSQALRAAVEAVRYARDRFPEVEFSAEDATRTEPGFLAEVVDAVIDAGAGTVNMPDTVGYALPEDIDRMFRGIRKRVGNRAVLSAHCHNDLGLAVANSLAAIQAGARQVECTVNGIGERAGNAALEEVVMALDVRRDRFDVECGIDTRQLFPSSQKLQAITGNLVQPNKAIVGSNAFAHEAGIHQDGVLKNAATYEIMTPERVGMPPSRLVLGKHSGRTGLRARLCALGVRMDDAVLERIFAAFKRLADGKSWISDDDLLAILEQEGLRKPSDS